MSHVAARLLRIFFESPKKRTNPSEVRVRTGLCLPGDEDGRHAEACPSSLLKHTQSKVANDYLLGASTVFSSVFFTVPSD